eukprot:1369849-Amphidinium_carterae.1
MDIDLLRPRCVATMNPVRSYGLRVASVYVALSLVVEELDAHSHSCPHLAKIAIVLDIIRVTNRTKAVALLMPYLDI